MKKKHFNVIQYKHNFVLFEDAAPCFQKMDIVELGNNGIIVVCVIFILFIEYVYCGEAASFGKETPFGHQFENQCSRLEIFQVCDFSVSNFPVSKLDLAI